MHDEITAADHEVARRLYPSLRRFAAVVARSEHDPDDLVHDALLNTLRTRRLADLDQPEAYLRRAIVNGARNGRRDQWRRATILARLRPNDVQNVSYPSDLADLERLAPHERAILYMKIVEGYRYAEIADFLGISEDAARARASRSAARLRLMLVEELRHG